MSRLMTAQNEVILRQLHAHGHCTVVDVAARLGGDGITPRQLGRRIEHLAIQGWIERADHGHSRGARWRATAEARPLLNRPDRLPTRPVPSRFAKGRPC